MKKIILFFMALGMLSCNLNSNKSASAQEEQEQPLVTYIYDGSKEICLYSDNTAKVNGQSGTWYESDKDFGGITADMCNVHYETRKYIKVHYGQNSLIIWPHTGLVFIGLDNVNASFDNPSDELHGKRCHKKR